MSGYLYCFSNESLKNLYKIGMTTRTVEERLKEANSNTWCPPTFKVEVSVKVNNVVEKEKILHKILEEYRSSSRREFFEVSLDKVKLLFSLLYEEESKEETKSQNIMEEIKKNNLTEPKGVQILKQDYYEEFIKLHKDFLEINKTYKDIYSKFYDWFSSKYVKKEVPTLETLIYNLEKRE